MCENIRELVTFSALDDVVQNQNVSIISALEYQDLVIVSP